MKTESLRFTLPLKPDFEESPGSTLIYYTFGLLLPVRALKTIRFRNMLDMVRLLYPQDRIIRSLLLAETETHGLT